MATTTEFALLIPVLYESAWDRDPTSKARAEPIPAQAGPSLPEELSAESVDEGWDPPETWDDYGGESWQYAKSVGMRLYDK